MGEYADMEVDRWIDDCDWGSRRRRSRPASVVCKFCGKRGLRWGKTPGGGWQVNERSGEPHTCLDVADDFQVLT